ncbi:MAG: 50S ribosomal protein L21 [Deltaproteobacteria bacterium]|nr:50S ribosomal protein L21 [Deltaproteobacteria bacterium]
MYAIVQSGAKQYKVKPGDQVKVERLDGEPGATIEIDRVLAVATPDGLQLGRPVIQDARVHATIVRTTKDRKIIVFKKKRRKAFDKKQGHRQWFTLLRINEISVRGAGIRPADESPAGAGDLPEGAAGDLSTAPVQTDQ